jgi:hypothetical protein
MSIFEYCFLSASAILCETVEMCVHVTGLVKFNVRLKYGSCLCRLSFIFTVFFFFFSSSSSSSFFFFVFFGISACCEFWSLTNSLYVEVLPRRCCHIGLMPQAVHYHSCTFQNIFNRHVLSLIFFKAVCASAVTREENCAWAVNRVTLKGEGSCWSTIAWGRMEE